MDEGADKLPAAEINIAGDSENQSQPLPEATENKSLHKIDPVDIAKTIQIQPSKEGQEKSLWSAIISPGEGSEEKKGFFKNEDAWDWANERREREFDRRSRELDRRERELERRERDLERRQREFEQDKARWMADVNAAPHWQDAIDSLRSRLEMELLAERKKTADREAELESKIMNKVNETLEKERQLYGVMRMSDNEVNEMVENSVGYLLQNDEDIADRVRFQSLLYLSQERLASEAGLEPSSGSGSLSVAWRVALGPSVATEDRYNKSLELLKDRELNESTRKLMENKIAMEYVVEYTSHLRKEGSEMGDHSFAPGRIARDDYMETVRRQANQAGVDYLALVTLIDFVCPK